MRESNVSLWNDYVSNSDFFLHLRELLYWHLVTEGAFLIKDIFDGSRELLENSIYNITVDQRFKKIDNVANSSLLYNKTSSEGVLIAMSDVLIPPHMQVDLIETLAYRDLEEKFIFSSMVNLAIHAGLREQIEAFYENGITFLVPPNGRFNRLNIDVAGMLKDEMKEYTRDFVLAHMIRDNYYEQKVFAYNRANDQEQFLVTTELGTHMWITTTDNILRFQSTKLIVPDQIARNG